MQKKVRRLSTQSEEVILEQFCNRCGASITLGSNNLHSFTLSGGYGTRFPEDLQTIQFELCSDCLREICEGFKHPPAASHFMRAEPLYPIEHVTTGLLYKGFVGWALPVGVSMPPCGFPEVEPIVEKGIYQEGSKLLDVQDVLYIWDEHQWGVVYQDLHGDSKYWIAPLKVFRELIDGEPRYRLLS